MSMKYSLNISMQIIKDHKYIKILFALVLERAKYNECYIKKVKENNVSTQTQKKY
jgi:hypothetical protein